MESWIRSHLWDSPGSRTEVKAGDNEAARGLGQSEVTAQPEGERLEKPSDPTGGLLLTCVSLLGGMQAPGAGGALCGSDLP